jgi:single-strand DNA-binding protein
MPLPRSTVEGRVVADPELRFSPNGVAVCRIRLVAQDRRFNKETNGWEDGDTLWLSVTCFKQLAENVAEHIKKGDNVIAIGKERTDEWQDRETNEKRSANALIADDIGKSMKFGPKRAERSTASSPVSGEADPWGSTGGGSDEPPF